MIYQYRISIFDRIWNRRDKTLIYLWTHFKSVNRFKSDLKVCFSFFNQYWSWSHLYQSFCTDKDIINTEERISDIWRTLPHSIFNAYVETNGRKKRNNRLSMQIFISVCLNSLFPFQSYPIFIKNAEDVFIYVTSDVDLDVHVNS